MADLEVLRSRLVEKIFSTKNSSLLEAIDKIFSSTEKEESEIELSDSHLKLLKIAEEDIKYGRVMTENELDKLDEEWMK